MESSGTGLNTSETLLKKIYFDMQWDFDAGYASDSVLLIAADALKNEKPAVAGILCKVLLGEVSFFENGSDITVFRQFRYLPPALHTYDFFRLIYVKSGNCRVYICGNDVSLIRGDVCIVSPGIEHAVWCDSDESDVLNILIRTSTFRDAFGDLLKGRDVLAEFLSHALLSKRGSSYLIFRTGDDEHFMQFVSFVEAEAGSGERYNSRMLNVLLNTMLIVLLRHHDHDVIFTPGSSNTDSRDIPEMIRYMQTHCADISLPALAKHFGYSERHTSRLIKEYTGLSFSEFTRNLKLKRATDILTNTSLPLTSISETAGYSDLSSFYRAFRKEYGMTPAEYREKLTSQ